MSNTALAGCRILVAEDDAIVGTLIEDILDAEQCITVGPYFHLEEALRAAQTEDIDLALLDVDLCGKKVYPVAEELSRRNIPFLLFSGYGAQIVPPEHPDWRCYSKPFKYAELLSRMRELVSATSLRGSSHLTVELPSTAAV